MKPKYLLIIPLIIFTSCFSYKATEYKFIEIKDCVANKKPYCYSTYFPFTFSRPFYKSTKDEIELSTLLVLVDSTLKVRLINIQPYLIKNNDTIKLKELEQFNNYSYPNIVNEPELYIHFDYTVEKKSDGSVKEVKEDFKLYRCKRTFRSVH